MADICYGIVSDGECEDGNSRAARRRRMEIRKFKFVEVESASSDIEKLKKYNPNQKLELSSSNSSPFPTGEYEYLVESHVVSSGGEGKEIVVKFLECSNELEQDQLTEERTSFAFAEAWIGAKALRTKCSQVSEEIHGVTSPRFGFASVCGRRRDMEDAVAVHPAFLQPQDDDNVVVPGNDALHYYAVYDGHGCSHVAMRCRDRLHELVREELTTEGLEAWDIALGRSFSRMDKEVISGNKSVAAAGNCKCELQTPECDAVGSTVVVAVVSPQKIVVANCGDSRAVLSRNGKPIPLSSDHKPDRPDELSRIQVAGGQVIYWEGARVLGVLAMSRAIGDNYLKPYVIPVPEITITDRTAEDDCLILASDGLWDVVSNDTACSIAAMCLNGKMSLRGVTTESNSTIGFCDDGVVDKACSDASMLLTKLALARHSTDNVSVVVVDLRRHKN